MGGYCSKRSPNSAADSRRIETQLPGIPFFCMPLCRGLIVQYDSCRDNIWDLTAEARKKTAKTMDTANNISATLWQEVDELIVALQAWGIHYLVGLDIHVNSTQIEADRQSATKLIQQLALCNNYPQVRDACISLFLLHPELTDVVLHILRESEPGIVEQVAVLTLATLYLQRLWSVRLSLAFGHIPNFPEQPFAYLWESRNLPLPCCHFGVCGLLALEKAEQRRTGLPFTFIGDWQNQIDQLLIQEEAKHLHLQHPLAARTLLKEEPGDEKELSMSMRPGVDKAAIESFLQQLGKTFRKPARLYLVGGAALVHLGVRPGVTQDIDIQVSGDNEGDLIVTIQRLINRLQINVEFASPSDFIPLPTQWEAHARFVGRYGNIDVFYFDFYSIALSKIERGNNRDIADVKLLLQQGIIILDELDKAYQEVLAQLGKGRYPRITPERFAARYQAMRPLL